MATTLPTLLSLIPPAGWGLGEQSTDHICDHLKNLSIHNFVEPDEIHQIHPRVHTELSELHHFRQKNLIDFLWEHPTSVRSVKLQ